MDRRHSCKMHGYFDSTVIKGDVPCPWCERDAAITESGARLSLLREIRRSLDQKTYLSPDLYQEFCSATNPESTKGSQQLPKGDRFHGTDNDFEHEDWCALYSADPAAGKSCDCGLADRLQLEKDYEQNSAITADNPPRSEYQGAARNEAAPGVRETTDEGTHPSVGPGAQGSVECELCGKQTSYTATRRCNGCWELETRIQGEPEIARRILNKLGETSG